MQSVCDTVAMNWDKLLKITNQMVAATPCTLPPTGERLLYILIVLCVLLSYSASFVIKVQFWITSQIIHYLLL